MKPILGEELRIFAFEGDRLEIKNQVDSWFSGYGKVFEVIDIQYNYQAPEYDGQTPITQYGMHGVLITARQLTVNDVRKLKGLGPISLASDHSCAVEECEPHDHGNATGSACLPEVSACAVWLSHHLNWDKRHAN